MALNVTVTLKDRKDTITAEIINPDRIRWDMTAMKHKWPSFADVPFLGSTFLAWAALRRRGEYTDSWENFRDRDAIHVESFDPDEDDEEIGGVGDPTL